MESAAVIFFVPHLTLFITPDSFKSPYCCTLSMITKTLEASRPLLLTSALPSIYFKLTAVVEWWGRVGCVRPGI